VVIATTAAVPAVGDLNRVHGTVRAQVEHALARLKTTVGLRVGSATTVSSVTI
jgi:hypothetical protein